MERRSGTERNQTCRPPPGICGRLSAWDHKETRDRRRRPRSLAKRMRRVTTVGTKLRLQATELWCVSLAVSFHLVKQTSMLCEPFSVIKPGLVCVHTFQL